MGKHALKVMTVLVDGRPVDITDRDISVLSLIAEGHPNKAIAEELGIDLLTLKNYHMQKLFRKLYVCDRAHAVAIAFRKGILK